MRFIHMADVHLGAVPDQGCPWSASRENERWDTFRRVVEMAEKEQVDLLLIAGDLFHRQPLLRELREVNYLFSRLSHTQVVWMAGNHDYLKKDSGYRKMEWASNVHGFFSQKPEILIFRELNTRIYGFSYENREISQRLYSGIRPGKEAGYHILLAHGGDEKHIPIQKEELTAFDYAALGHIHKPQALVPDRIQYAGALEPLDRNEEGPHGFWYGRMEEGKCQTTFVPAASRSYLTIKITVHSGTVQMSLEQKIREAIALKGERNLYRIQLKGFRNPELEFSPERLFRLGNITEVQDLTDPCYDIERLKQQQRGTLLGEYMDSFEGKSSRKEQKALYYGVQALMESKK